MGCRVLFHLLAVGEGNAVNPLQRLVLAVAEEVSGGVLGDGERGDFASGGNVGAAAEVDEWPAAVGGAPDQMLQKSSGGSGVSRKKYHEPSGILEAMMRHLNWL